MQFSFSLSAVLLGLASSVAAQAFPNNTQEFLLKSTVISGPVKFDNLCPSTYHTGAGLSDAVLTSNCTTSVKSYFNGTSEQLLLDFGQPFPWGWVPGYEAYAAWNPMYINAGDSEGSFVIQNGSLTLSASGTSATTWLACDWWHGVPQLFWYDSSYLNATIPTSCATITLTPEFL